MVEGGGQGVGQRLLRELEVAAGAADERGEDRAVLLAEHDLDRSPRSVRRHARCYGCCASASQMGRISIEP